jgi:hypothetical protein
MNVKEIEYKMKYDELKGSTVLEVIRKDILEKIEESSKFFSKKKHL